MDRGTLKQLIYRYEAAHFVVERRVRLLLRDLIPEELTVEQFKTMRYLYHNGSCTSSELADVFCVGKSSITAIISRLSNKGLVMRLPELKDRRVFHLTITEQAKELCERMEEQIQELLSGYMCHFEDDEAFSFIGAYERLGELMKK